MMNSIHIEQNRYGNWTLVKSTVRLSESTGTLWATDQCKLNTTFIELADAQRHALRTPSDVVVYLTPYVRPCGVGVFNIADLGEPCHRTVGPTS